MSTDLQHRPSDAVPQERRRRPAGWLLAGALLAPVLLVGGGILFTGDGPAPAAPSPVGVVDAAVAGDQTAAMAALEERVRRLPDDDAAWASLGLVYLGQARVTADPSFYARAEEALARSLEVRPEANVDALAGQAALAGSRHDFAGARELAAAAVTADPYSSTARGVLADAQLELGEYDAAAATLQEMVDLRPGVPSFTRVSYLFELRGETEQARTLLRACAGPGRQPRGRGLLPVPPRPPVRRCR